LCCNFPGPDTAEPEKEELLTPLRRKERERTLVIVIIKSKTKYGQVGAEQEK
jgi:hypothetical protein